MTPFNCEDDTRDIFAQEESTWDLESKYSIVECYCGCRRSAAIPVEVYKKYVVVVSRFDCKVIVGTTVNQSLGHGTWAQVYKANYEVNIEIWHRIK